VSKSQIRKFAKVFKQKFKENRKEKKKKKGKSKKAAGQQSGPGQQPAHGPPGALTRKGIWPAPPPTDERGPLVRSSPSSSQRPGRARLRWPPSDRLHAPNPTPFRTKTPPIKAPAAPTSRPLFSLARDAYRRNQSLIGNPPLCKLCRSIPATLVSTRSSFPS
jgi:hypothetical protein